MNQAQQIMEAFVRGVSPEDKSLIRDVVVTLKDMGGKVIKKGATKATVELDGIKIGVAAKNVRSSGDWSIEISSDGDWGVSNRRDIASVKFDPEKDSIFDVVERSLKALRSM